MPQFLPHVMPHLLLSGAGPPLSILVEVLVTSFDSVSEVSQDYTVTLYFLQHWHDMRLAFAPDQPDRDITLSGAHARDSRPAPGGTSLPRPGPEILTSRHDFLASDDLIRWVVSNLCIRGFLFAFSYRTDRLFHFHMTLSTTSIRLY